MSNFHSLVIFYSINIHFNFFSYDIIHNIAPLHNINLLFSLIVYKLLQILFEMSYYYRENQ